MIRACHDRVYGGSLSVAMSLRIRIDPTACTGHGVCADLLPERIQLDEWGFPVIQPEVAPGLAATPRRAIRACPVLALRLQRTKADPREGSTMTVPDRRHHRRDPDASAGVAGNERLTALTGTILLAGFAIEGLTILAIHRLLTLHFFLGILLIGPVLVKIGSTGYRFARYYTGAPPYVRKGPPAWPMRLLGPFVILTSLTVLGTGVLLGIAGPGNGPWLFLHKASFVLWFGCMALHVATYRLAAAPPPAGRAPRPRRGAAERSRRRGPLAAGRRGPGRRTPAGAADGPPGGSLGRPVHVPLILGSWRSRLPRTRTARRPPA